MMSSCVSGRTNLPHQRSGVQRPHLPASPAAGEMRGLHQGAGRVKPHVLALGPFMPDIMAALGRDFTLHKLYEAENRDALLAEIGPLVRGIASTAFIRADAA